MIGALIVINGACRAQAKMLVFLTTGKQVKFALEAFRRLRPGVVLRALHGKMKQMKRMAVYYDFCQASHAAAWIGSSAVIKERVLHCIQLQPQSKQQAFVLDGCLLLPYLEASPSLAKHSILAGIK